MYANKEAYLYKKGKAERASGHECDWLGLYKDPYYWPPGLSASLQLRRFAASYDRIIHAYTHTRIRYQRHRGALTQQGPELEDSVPASQAGNSRNFALSVLHTVLLLSLVGHLCRSRTNGLYYCALALQARP